MALPININDLIEKKTIEGARIEYKRDWNPESVLHTICAFANDIDNWGGGYIILGIEEDNGMPKYPVAGLNRESIDSINKDIIQKCNLIEPRYITIVEQTEYNGASILIVWVPGGNSRPYKCPVTISSDKIKKSEKVYFIRKLSSTIRANSNEEKELFQISEVIPFDDRINNPAALNDLKPALIENYLYEVKSDLQKPSQNMSLSELARNMHIVGGPSENLKPLNVGLLFFNYRPDEYFRYARIEVVDKPDPTGQGMTEKIFTGPIDAQLREALTYIKSYIIKEKITKVAWDPRAVRVFNYPYLAVEEALSNAVYHKSYQIPEPITVTVTPDRMEIVSIPGPDRSITDDDMVEKRLVAKKNRNRRIGDFLKELNLIEGRNTGVPAMIRSMKDNGSDPPIFETDIDRSYFTTILPVHPEFFISEQESFGLQNEYPKSRRGREENKDAILKTLKQNGSMSVKDLSRALGYSAVSPALRKIIDELIDDNYATYLYPDKKRSPKQKIQLSGQ
ncbi:MAG: putative DNA binding domain-containing protein [Candidatus Methanoplasma sp.]|jgi:ATP-dependent DNA helicase RecG|nr:putative DNA binding domain-containing protein [Candidatus Methanoplasma sp.]